MRKKTLGSKTSKGGRSVFEQLEEGIRLESPASFENETVEVTLKIPSYLAKWAHHQGMNADRIYRPYAENLFKELIWLEWATYFQKYGEHLYNRNLAGRYVDGQKEKDMLDDFCKKEKFNKRNVVCVSNTIYCHFFEIEENSKESKKHFCKWVQSQWSDMVHELCEIKIEWPCIFVPRGLWPRSGFLLPGNIAGDPCLEFRAEKKK